MTNLLLRVIRAEFVRGMTTFDAEHDLSQHPQVVCVGRSNAGKSTFINRIVGQRKLARTSAQPGRTQQINIFECMVASDEGRVPFALVDLPGYGYAKASKAKKGELSALLINFLSTAEQMRVCFLIQDIRRDAEEEELALRDLLFKRDATVLPVLTKADKLRSGERKERAKRIAQQYNLQPSDLIITGEGESVQDVLNRIYHLCAHNTEIE